MWFYAVQLDKNTRLLYLNSVLHPLAVACLNYQQPLEGQQPCMLTSAHHVKVLAPQPFVWKHLRQLKSHGKKECDSSSKLQMLSDPLCLSFEVLQLLLFTNHPPSSLQVPAPAFQAKAVAIERLTHNQSNCSSSYIHCCNRTTASEFYNVVRRKKAINAAFVKHSFEGET